MKEAGIGLAVMQVGQVAHQANGQLYVKLGMIDRQVSYTLVPQVGIIVFGL